MENIDFKILSLISAEQAHAFQAVPLKKENGHICYLVNEDRLPNAQEMEIVLGQKIKFVPTPATDFEKYLLGYYPKSGNEGVKQKISATEESDVIRLVDKIFGDAVSLGASDIHIERYESYARVRFRWEGKLIEKYEVDQERYNAVVSRIKILSELDISERRLPQDGRINLTHQGQKIDIRVSTIPGKFGEKVVMRLLTRSKQFLQLENLGMNAGHLETYLRAIQQPNGIILITGPTGSGKTTTLYATLNRLNNPDINITTVEDPIEYNLEGINQVQVKDEIGLSFEKSLRAFLRQDPDVIMVGEIRDKATADIAVRAALTGHLVFSTLHTNSAIDAIARLSDMGVPPYLISASVRLVVAQRLIRVLCENCKQSTEEIIDNKIQIANQITTHYKPKGCSTCNFTGYTRRKAVYETLSINEDVANLIKTGNLDRRSILPVRENEGDLKTEVLKMIHLGETSLREGMSYLLEG
ncbi:MAG: GspE/PulE family protein [Bacteroidia bacterium]